MNLPACWLWYPPSPQRKVESQREGGHAGATGSRGCYFVPEPETYALMLAGQGLVGFAARRGKSA